MNFFKYAKKKYAFKMVRDGVFRIGTFSDFKNIERHGEEVGDKNEATLSTKMEGHVVDTNDPSSISPVAKRILSMGNFRAGQVIMHVETINERTNDCYIFSVSDVLDHGVMKRMNPDYDACIEILDINDFLNALTDCIKRTQNLDGLIARKCIYANREQTHSQQVDCHPAFVKPIRYSYQKEYRALWIPKVHKIEPIFITCQEAKKFCKMADL